MESMMVTEQSVQLWEQAAEEFDRRENREDGSQVVRGLTEGLTVLRSLVFERVYHDVQLAIGLDSMLLPVSAIRSEQRALQEIELFQIAEAALVAQEQFIRSDGDWFVPWLVRLRLGDNGDSTELRQRLSSYLKRSADDRRLRFGDIMADVFPMSRRAPLVLFRLLPLAVQVATALAFGDHLAAAEFRSRQLVYLPAIEDCQNCHGMPLENGDKCRHCSNPLWNHEWLTSAD